MIHIVFQEADVEVLKSSFLLDGSMEGEIIQVKDDLAVGPIEDIFSEQGMLARKEWWKGILEGGDYHGKVGTGDVDDDLTISNLILKLDNDPEEFVWIWAAQNAHDVSGYYWLVSQLKEYQGRIHILYLNNLPFINDKGHLFYPTNLFEISPKEFIKAKKLSRIITPSEFEVDPDEWLKLMQENKGVRILEGGKKLSQHEYDYYDNDLMKFITNDWQRVNKLLHSFFSRSKITTGDAYLLWRIKQLIVAQKIDAQGEIRNMKEFEVKRKMSHGTDQENS